MSAITLVVEDMAVDLLELAAAALDDAGQAAPERQFVTHSDLSPQDCNQLTVHLGSLRPKVMNDPAGVNQRSCTISWVARLTLTLLRCVTALEDSPNPIPSAATLDAEFRSLLRDGEAVARYLSRQWATGVWPTGGSCSDVTWGSLDPIPPSTVAGWRLPIDVQLS